MLPFIIVADGLDKEVFASLKDHDQLEVYPKSKLTQAELKELLPKAQAIIIRSATTMNQELIDLAPNLKYIIRAGEGTDNIDKAYCQQRGISVSNTPGANNNSAAEHALALMMTVLRKTAFAHHSMNQGRWDKSLFVGNELTSKTVGIVGFGRIGQILAKRLAGFEPNVLYYDPFIESSELSYVSRVQSLEEIFEKSDIISIHTPLMEATKNLITKDLFDRMKPQAILVNASRGKIVNEDDLYQALSEGKLKGAGFDVFATEPLPQDSPLRELGNIVLTPHLGASTEEAQKRVGEMVLHQLVEFFTNNQLLNEVRV